MKACVSLELPVIDKHLGYRYIKFLVRFRKTLHKIGYKRGMSYAIVKSFDSQILTGYNKCDLFDLENIFEILNCKSVFNWANTNEGYNFWQRLNKEIKSYEEKR